MHLSYSTDAPSIGAPPNPALAHADSSAAAPSLQRRPGPDLSARWARDINARLFCMWRTDPPLEGCQPPDGRRQGGSSPAPAAHFSLDSYHLTVLDRFVARARRHARHSGRPFTGVVIEIDHFRSLRVHAVGLESLVLKDCFAAAGADSSDPWP
jgi:hypothetical protein